MVVPAGRVTTASSPSWKLGPAVGMGSQGGFQGPGCGIVLLVSFSCFVDLEEKLGGLLFLTLKIFISSIEK